MLKCLRITKFAKSKRQKQPLKEIKVQRLSQDPYQLKNVEYLPKYVAQKRQLTARMEAWQQATQAPRVQGQDPFLGYVYYGERNQK